METKVIKIDAETIDSAAIEQAAEAIDAGRLVAFPTETVYGIACRVAADSLAELDNIKGRPKEKSYSLHIGKKNEISKYVPVINLVGLKLIQNAWPGPVTIVFELSEKDAKKQRENLGSEVFDNLYHDNTIGIRCPDEPVAIELLKQTKNPVVAPSANISGQEPAVDAEQVMAQLAGKIALVLDAGRCKYKKSSTVVKIGKRGLEILRQGIYSKEKLQAVSQVKFLFVCTGNTCRSPMAEGLFKKYLAEKLHCKVDELEQVGYKVSSAGVIGSSGWPASYGAIASCAARGVDIGAHRNQGLTQELIDESDFIFAMEKIHCNSIIALSPDAQSRCMLLADNAEVFDPIGSRQEVYNNCAGIIEKAVNKRLNELVL